jgi:hypothetical protein
LRQKGRERDTYGQLPGPVQTLDLINPVPDRLQLLVKVFFFDDFLCGVKNQKRIRPDVVIDVDADNVEAVQF